MNVESWVLVDTDDLGLIHSLSHGAAINIPGTTPATSSSINTTEVTPSNIDASSFLKYINVRLSGKSGVLNFHDNLYVQSKWLNIFLCPSSEITTLLGVVPDYMDPDYVSAMGTALHSKMSQVDTIAENYYQWICFSTTTFTTSVSIAIN